MCLNACLEILRVFVFGFLFCFLNNFFALCLSFHGWCMLYEGANEKPCFRGMTGWGTALTCCLEKCVCVLQCV